VLSAPRLEQPAGRRLDMTNLPWWLIASAIALAIVGATAAAWWPARSVARVPTMLALSGRPPRPAPARGWLPLAVALVTLGVVALGVAEPEENLLGAFMMMFGVIASVLGLLLFSPVAIRALAATARWFPVAVRLALRDLARYQARSGFALAAVSLALGIPLALVVTATVAEHSAAEGNLSSQQLLIRPGDPADPDGPCPGPVQSGVGGAWWTNSSGPCPFVPARVTDDLSRLEAVVGDIARLAGQSEVMTLDVAVDPAMPVGPEGYQVVTLASDIGDVGLIDVSLLFVATPALLAHYGVELTEVPSTTEFLTVVTGDLKLTGAVDPDTGRFVPRRLQNVHQLSRGYTSLPGTFITPDALRDHGWDTVRAGWLLEMDRPLADDEFAIARDMAVDAGVIIERRDEQQNLASLRTRATGAAVAVALSVLAMTVGLIRAEAANELRTLAATGATSRIRRSLTAATTGAMAFLGVALAMAGTYLVVGALRFGDLGDLAQVPVLHLAVIAVGVPLAATVGGWLLAGREPASLARQPLE
jgi:putative ABC transport system permease protein